jgi:Caspase domain
VKQDDLFSDVLARDYFLSTAAADVNEPSQQSFINQVIAKGIQLLPQRTGIKFKPRFSMSDDHWHFEVKSCRSHHPRTVRMCGFDPRDTAFWINLVIGCDGPSATLQDGSMASRPLANALSDLFALRSFYQPAAIGGADVIYPMSVSRSAGFFSHTICLANPDLAQLQEAYDSIGHWLMINGNDPEFRNFQLNFFFSGHGGGGSIPGDSGICLSDGVHYTTDLVNLMLERLSRYNISAARWQNTLFLDCCHAAAVGRDFVGTLLGTAGIPGRLKGVGELAMHLMLLSSMHDESSFDMPLAGTNSFFTAAYLRENSARSTPRSYGTMADIALQTQGRQHPVLLRLGETYSLRFPAFALIDSDAKTHAIEVPDFDDQFAAALHGLGWEDVKDAPGRIEPLLAQASVLRDRVRANQIRRRARVVPYAKREERWDI